MKKIILITGANGMLAKHLTKELEQDYDIRFLTRNVTRKNQFYWDLKKKYIDPDAFNNVHSIIHLAGSPIADKKWTKKRKKIILSSRVDSADLILDHLKKSAITIDSFISASAIGFYGTSTTDVIFDEESNVGKGFLSMVCNEWENAAHKFESSNIANRTITLRIGIILSKKGGALKKIMGPVKYGIGLALGTGKQYMPWIHIQDLCDVIKFSINNIHLKGTFNAVAPEHVTNSELTRRIGNLFGKPKIFTHIPQFMIRLIYGERSLLLLGGSRVSSTKIVKQGFSFKYDNLDKALKDIFLKKRS